MSETAAEHLRAAAQELRGDADRILRTNRTSLDRRPGVGLAVADWLDEEAGRVDDPSAVLVGIFSRRPLEVAAAVLGRTWTP